MKVTKDQVNTLAKIVHQANKAFCEEEGDTSQKDWDKISDDLKKPTIDGVQAIVDDQTMTPEKSHEVWSRNKKAQGYVYGKIKDDKKKTHPCLVPYHQLDDVQKYKDHLFFAIVKSYLDFK